MKKTTLFIFALILLSTTISLGQILVTTSNSVYVRENINFDSKVVELVPSHKNLECLAIEKDLHGSTYLKVFTGKQTGYIHISQINYDDVYYLLTKAALTNDPISAVYKEHALTIDRSNRNKIYEESIWSKQNNFTLLFPSISNLYSKYSISKPKAAITVATISPKSQNFTSNTADSKPNSINSTAKETKNKLIGNWQGPNNTKLVLEANGKGYLYHEQAQCKLLLNSWNSNNSILVLNWNLSAVNCFNSYTKEKFDFVPKEQSERIKYTIISKTKEFGNGYKIPMYYLTLDNLNRASKGTYIRENMDDIDMSQFE